MVAYPEFFNSARTATHGAPIEESVAAGAAVPARTVWIYNDREQLNDATPLVAPELVLEAWDGRSWLRSGSPVLDEHWFQVAVTDVDAAADEEMAAQSTEYLPLGSGEVLALEDISPGCGRELTIEIIVPPGASTSAPRVRLVLQ